MIMMAMMLHDDDGDGNDDKDGDHLMEWIIVIRSLILLVSTVCNDISSNGI